MSIKIALAGNPNCGKTTLFNALTGSNQFVGNWPGVTVEKKEGKLKGNKDVTIMDLPGIYSLSPYTLEEVVARNYLIAERPDAILNIVDGTNIERNLYLSTQLMELGIPVIMFLLKEPLGQLVEGKKPKAEGGVGMFLVQGFFELFETMLSFFSNTISFVRIGAFAVSHAAMMEVVLMLGGITDGAGNPNWIIIVLGNIIVCGLEGLVVGIQVLRLEYYEMFSRFYTGSGREFHPYDNHAGKEN